MVDLRRIVVIFVIAVLFAIFVFSAIEAVYPKPRYNDFCANDIARPYPVQKNVNCAALNVPDNELVSCNQNKGQIIYQYDSNGCPVSYQCDNCAEEYDNARADYNMVIFIISAILGLIAIIISLYLPLTNEMNEWIGTGFMLGGLFVLFFGTARYFSDLSRYLRPVVILAELLIVIYLAYKKLSKTEPKKSSMRKK